MNYVKVLHPAIEGNGVFSASVCIGIPIVNGDERESSDKLAERYVEFSLREAVTIF